MARTADGSGGALDLMAAARAASADWPRLTTASTTLAAAASAGAAGAQGFLAKAAAGQRHAMGQIAHAYGAAAGTLYPRDCEIAATAPNDHGSIF